MESDRFDRWTRSLSSRRSALTGVAGALAALLGLARPEAAAAHNFLARCRRIKNVRSRRACLRRARAHNRTHQSPPPPCVPQPVTTTCAGRCGVWRNNCNQEVACFTCPPGRDCLGNGSCAQTCTTDSCPAGCSCSGGVTGPPRYCIRDVLSCTDVPQTCTSVAMCPVGMQCQLTVCGPGDTFEYRCIPLC